MKKEMGQTLFRFASFIVRCYTWSYQVYSRHDIKAPAVYVVHHQNMRGPIISMAWLRLSLRPWVLSVFCERKECFNQFYTYTFTKRFGLPKPLAAAITLPISYGISNLMTSMRAIPVYRSSKAIVKTFWQSIEALEKGESLLISPDIDYANSTTEMGEMYHGFLDLEKRYRQSTGKTLPFVPLHIDRNSRKIVFGEAIYFNTETDFKQGKIAVIQHLKQEFSRLETQQIF